MQWTESKFSYIKYILIYLCPTKLPIYLKAFHYCQIMLDASSRISKTSWIRFILFMIMYKWICYLHTSSFKFIWDFVILSTSEQKQLHRKWRIDWVFLIILLQHLHRKPYLNFLFNCSVLIYSIWNPSKRCHFNVLAYFAY